MSKKRKLKIGDAFDFKNTNLIIEEFFVADFIRWVRCSKLRKKGKVIYDKKVHKYYESENTYMTELEVIRAIKANVS
jgi:transposase